MTSLKLETFSLDQNGSGALASLRSETLERERNEAYANGFKDGVNVTRDAVNTERNRLLAAILETVSDERMNREEAAVAAVRSVRPVVEALVSHLAPQLVKTGFAAQIWEAVSRARQLDETGDITIRLNPSQIQDVTDLFADHPMSVALAGDANLDPLEAQVVWADGYDHLDFNMFLSQLDGVIENFRTTTEEGRDERNRHIG